jgi:formylmethanofuran dehydrogenase subunit A
MFSLPRYVIKSGEILVDDGEIRKVLGGRTLHVAPSYDPGCEADIAQWFEQYYSIRFRNYPVGEQYLHDAQQVPCT